MHFLIINIFKQKLYSLSIVLSFLLLLLIHSFLQSFEFVDIYFNIYLFVLFFITIMLYICFYIFFKNISVLFNDIKSKKAGLELQKKYYLLSQ